MKKTILFLCLCYLVGVTYAQEPFRVMFYNVENLFDCQHDTLKNDYEFFSRCSERMDTSALS